MNIVTAAIALFALAIAGAHWWNTRQSLALGLFEKRFQVFMDVRKIASEALQGAAVTSKGLTNEIFTRGRFLFGPELVREFERLHALVGDLETGGGSTVAIEISEHFAKITPLFEPYLKMQQRMPSLPFGLGG
jgi:hypothetical protein